VVVQLNRLLYVARSDISREIDDRAFYFIKRGFGSMQDGIADPDAGFADNWIHRHWRQIMKVQLKNRQELEIKKTEMCRTHYGFIVGEKAYLSVS
jgi:hypothetical protein